MYGQVFLMFRPESAFVDPSSYAPNPGDDPQNLTKFREAIVGTRISHLTAANNVHHDGNVARDNSGKLCARVGLYFDTQRNEFSYERDFNDLDGIRVEGVELVCWMKVRGNRLPRGTWRDVDARIGALIVNDPSKEDLSRVQIRILAPTVKSAREALFQTLTGERKPEKPWLV